MIDTLKYYNAATFIEEIETDGHHPLLIIADNFEVYYIKNTKDKEPAIEIINEFISHYLLKIWNINTPDIAAINVDTKILPDKLSNFHKSYFYRNLCFGSKKINNSIEMNNFIEINSKINFNKFQNPEDLLKLSLFDIWIENDDRKPSNPNVLFDFNESKIKIVAIDNAFTFATMNYSDISGIKGVVQSYNDNILYSDFARNILKYITKQNIFIDNINKYFYLCIEKSKDNFKEIVKNIPGSLGFTAKLQNYLFAFLFNKERNKKVLIDFYSRL